MRNHANPLFAMTRSIVVVFLLGFVATAAAQPRSDYEIVKSFQAKYKAIKEAIKEAKTVQDCADISANITELEKEFAADTVLLNKSLYPDKYDDMIDNVNGDLSYAQNKLGLIETQVARITDLEMQVRTLSGKVDSLSSENDKLMASLDVMSKALEKNTKAIDSLNKVIGRLREGLRARDAAIFALVDSMFMQYGNNVQGLPDQQKNMLLGKVERHSVVANVLQAAEQNMKFLESTQLTGKDLVQMLKEQHKFSSYWNGLGPRLANLYVNKRERAKQVAAVDTAIAQWGRKADSTLWSGLNAEFTSNKIDVQHFSNGSEFVTSLGAYLDSQGGDLKASTSEKAARLKNFMDNVWNPSVGTQWLPMLVDEGIITKDQQTQLQTKLAAWQGAAQPSNWLTYTIIIIILVVLVIFVVSRRKKSPLQGQKISQN